MNKNNPHQTPNKQLADQIPARPHGVFSGGQRENMSGPMIAEKLFEQEKNKINVSEQVWEIANQLKEILVIQVLHDTHLTKKQRQKLPADIDRYIDPSRNTSWKYYIFKNASWANAFVWYAGGTQWRLIDEVMDEFIKKVEKDPKLQSLLRKKVLSLKELYAEVE